MVMNFTVYARNVIFFFCKQKTKNKNKNKTKSKKKKKKKNCEIPIFRAFLVKNSILHCKLVIWAKSTIVRCHCDAIYGMFILCWYAWEEETHSYTMVPGKYTSGVYFSSSQEGCWLDMLQKIAWLDEG